MAVERKPRVTTLVIDSALENLSRLGVSVRNICESTPLNRMDAYYVELCTIEAVTNAIKHAYRLQPGHKVELTVSIADDGITIQICDTGEPMNAAGLTPALTFDPEKPETAPDIGMGMFLIHKLMDHVLYEQRDGRNILTLKKYITAPGTGGNYDHG